jgi:hypothetical protein
MKRRKIRPSQKHSLKASVGFSGKSCASDIREDAHIPREHHVYIVLLDWRTQFDAPGDGEPDRLGYLNVNTYRLPWLDFKGKGLCHSRHVRINEVKNAFLLLLESVVRF